MGGSCSRHTRGEQLGQQFLLKNLKEELRRAGRR